MQIFPQLGRTNCHGTCRLAAMENGMEWNEVRSSCWGMMILVTMVSWFWSVQGFFTNSWPYWYFRANHLQNTLTKVELVMGFHQYDGMLNYLWFYTKRKYCCDPYSYKRWMYSTFNENLNMAVPKLADTFGYQVLNFVLTKHEIILVEVIKQMGELSRFFQQPFLNCFDPLS